MILEFYKRPFEYSLQLCNTYILKLVIYIYIYSIRVQGDIIFYKKVLFTLRSCEYIHPYITEGAHPLKI